MLGVCVTKLGSPSETYLAHHIDDLYPGRTVVCSLMPFQNPSWTPAAPVFEAYRSAYLPVRLVRGMLGVINPNRRMNFDLARIAMWLAKHRVQVVLCEYLQVATTVAGVCRRLGIPIVAHAHGYDITAQPKVMGWEETYRTELPRLAEVVVVSTHMKERILEYGVSPARVHVVPCGAATLDESVARDLEETYSNRSRNGDGFKLVAVGRLVAKKGPMFLLEAFRQIRASGVPAELYIIGDGPFREAMSQWIASNHFGESVRLVGALPNPEVRRHLREADLFLQHSITAEDGDEEGLPVAILEAMAEGVPVVSTLHAGIPEAVCHGETGFLVRPGDCRAMADKACDLLRDGKLRHRMGRAARTVVTTQFSLNRQIDTLRNIVQKYMH